MKKKLIVLVIVESLLMSGCKKDGLNFTKNDNWDTKWHTQMERCMGYIVPYQNGFYHLGVPNCLSYYDIDSAQSVVLCDKNGCSHTDEKCFAYVDAFLSMPEVHNDKLYFMSDDGEVSVANVDNTEKKKEFILLKKEKEKESLVFVTEFLMTEEYLFFQAMITEYSEEFGEKTEENVYAWDLESKKEILIASVEDDKKNINLISAYKDILYYSCSDQVLSNDVELTEMTQKEFQEAEKNMHEELYRKDMKKEKEEKVIEVNNGYLMAATDDFGVYYTEFLGTGYSGSRKLFRVKPGENDAELVFSTDDPMGFAFGEKNAEYVWIIEGDKQMLYSLETMEPIQMEWEYPNQPAYAYPVPGGFAVPKNPMKDEDSRNYLGEEWKFLRM